MLPTGTVTFLFTDIEGSTRLLQTVGGRYGGLLGVHQAIVREAIDSQGGLELSTEGDAFFAVFPSAQRAVEAAIRAQRALSAQEWPADGVVRVRMGLHTGEGVLGGDNYAGLDVNRAARIMAAGHGGQVLCSATTRELVAGSLSAGCELIDLGIHRLKDLERPERLYQATGPGLPADFPALRTLDARPTNLPSPVSALVGRETEIEAVRELLRDGRLVTLTGPGGSGKTRLALAVAHRELASALDGAFFVDLAPLVAPELVGPMVAHVLELTEEFGRGGPAGLAGALADRRMLLLLDNFEQVTAAATLVSVILEGTHQLRILVTSQAPLRLRGEREFPVLPLSVPPDPLHPPDPERLSQYAAVALFLDRARAVRPDFLITAANAPAIAQICAGLDGLPLAIELAAVRVKLLSPEAIVARLRHRLTFLIGGQRDLPERQQTIRGAIEWSFGLLEPKEQHLFAGLGIFVGGFDLPAVESVLDGDGALAIDPFEGVSSLIDKSLVQSVPESGGEPRFGMLQTIAAFARERLVQDDREQQLAERHASFFLTRAEALEIAPAGHRQGIVLGQIDADNDNFRAALAWSIRSGRSEIGFRLAAALWRYWQFRGFLAEGRAILDALLDLPREGVDPACLSRGLEAAGSVAYWLADAPNTERHYAEALRVEEGRGDPRGIAHARYNLAFARVLANDLEGAKNLLLEALVGYRAVGDRVGEALVQNAFGFIAAVQREPEAAMTAADAAMALFREIGDQRQVAESLTIHGLAARFQHEPAAAGAAMREALRILSGLGDVTMSASVVEQLAAIAMDAGDLRRSIRLLGARDMLREDHGAGTAPMVTTISGDPREMARGVLPDLEIEAAYRAGRGLSPEEAYAEALGP